MVKPVQGKRYFHERPLWTLLIALGVLAVVALGVGVLVGRSTATQIQSTTPLATSESARSSAPPVAQQGTRFASSTDAVTGARLTVAIVPATGWIRINATISAVPANESYQLFIIDKEGSRHLFASWRSSPEDAVKGANVAGSAIMDPTNVTAIEVITTSGQKYVTASF